MLKKKRYRPLRVYDDLLEKNPTTREASQCVVIYSPSIDELLFGIYGREGLCLKLLTSRRYPDGIPEGEEIWQKAYLDEVSMVQNIFARVGISPRVYDLVRVNDKYPAQVCDYVVPGDREKDTGAVLSVMERYGIVHRRIEIIQNEQETWRNGMLVDLGGFKFRDLGDYERGLSERIRTRKGKIFDSAYQPVKAMKIDGARDLDYRVEFMGLDKRDWSALDVLDIGCNTGGISRIIDGYGARRVVGIDKPEKAELAFEISNLLGNWNIDYLGVDATREDLGDYLFEMTGIRRFDVVMFLAVFGHLMRKVADKLSSDGCSLFDECTTLSMLDYEDEKYRFVSDKLSTTLLSVVEGGGIVYFEGHGGLPKEAYDGWLRATFRSVNYMGMTNDNYPRAVYWCFNG